MRNKIDYNNIFNEIYISIPKSIKGDDYEIKEIKISKNKLYNPQYNKTLVSDINKIKSLKKKQSSIDSNSNSNNENEDDINTQRQITTQTYKYCIYTNPSNLIVFIIQSFFCYL